MAFLSSFKRALTVHFLLVGSVPVLLFGLVSVELVAEQQLKGVHERNIAQARAVAEEVDAFLSEVRSDLQHVQQTIAAETILQAAKKDSAVQSWKHCMSRQVQKALGPNFSDIQGNFFLKAYDIKETRTDCAPSKPE